MSSVMRGTLAENKRPLPASWRWVRLGEVCELISANINPQEEPEGVFAHYSIPAFDEGQTPVIEPGSAILSNKVLFPRGSVLFSKLNPRISRVWHVNDDHGHRRICSTEFLPLVPHQSYVDPNFLTLVLQEPAFISELRAQVSAATKSRERLKPELVLNAWLPLPPLATQQHIAALLSEQLAAVARARTAAKARLEAAEALPATYLHAVFSSAEAQRWPRKRLGDVGETVSGITLGRRLNGVNTRSIPYLRVANVKDGYLDLSEVYQIEATEAEIEKCRLQWGDLLLTEGGDPDKLGRGTFWEEQIPECIHQNHIFRVRFNLNEFSPQFLAAQVGSPYGKAYFLAHAKQTTGIATINQKVLAGFPLMTPPLAEQQRIAAQLAGQMAVVERLCAALEAELTAINSLPVVLLRQAFSGEL